MRLEMSMLGAVRRIGRFVDDIRLSKADLNIPDAAVEFEQDVSARTLDTGLRTFVVENRGADVHRFLGIENSRQQLIVHLQAAASLFCSSHAVRHHGRDALTHVTDHVVQNVSVVGIGVIIVVIGPGKQPPRDILPREDRMDPGHRQRTIPCEWTGSARGREATGAVSGAAVRPCACRGYTAPFP